LLDTTSLVHEWYERFVRAGTLRIEDRAHFMRYAGRAMRTIIVDFARRRGAACRGGGAGRLELTEAAGVVAGADEIVRVHEALGALAELDPRMVQVVELRYFGGLSEVEIADALGVNERTVRRDWEKARLWLTDALRG
jgi:RNA polymerase sigma factor (TIGR02999 family)